jgi:hypothetical protein
LWATASLLNQYDIVIDACQGAAPTDKPQASLDNIYAFAASGGRVYMSHYENYLMWPTGLTSQWSTKAVQDTTMPVVTGTSVAADIGFPKGSALGQWALTAGTSTTLGNITITPADWRDDVTSVTAPTTQWLTGANPANIYQLSFYAGSASCGKVAYADFHVSAGSQPVAVFPNECAQAGADPGGTDLFEFFLFDTMSCAQDDTKAPVAPPL